MPARAFVIRFPDGDFEYDFTRRGAPSIGETLRRKGSLWLVTGIDGDDLLTVHVEGADGDLAAAEGEDAESSP